MTNRLLSTAVLALLATIATVTASGRGGWTSAQLEELRSMSLGELESLPRDPPNRVADDPRAADLGRRLFFDTRLSSNGRVACSTCHPPDPPPKEGTTLASGGGTPARRTMPIAAMARSPFLFWDGRKDSLWAQALGPLEDAAEHGGNRVRFVQLVQAHYKEPYRKVFGAMPALAALPADASPSGTEAERAAWK